MVVPRTVFQLRRSSSTDRKVLPGISWRCPCLGVFYIDLRIKRVILHRNFFDVRICHCDCLRLVLVWLRMIVNALFYYLFF